jgi:hypothetical protein
MPEIASFNQKSTHVLEATAVQPGDWSLMLTASKRDNSMQMIISNHPLEHSAGSARILTCLAYNRSSGCSYTFLRAFKPDDVLLIYRWV